MSRKILMSAGLAVVALSLGIGTAVAGPGDGTYYANSDKLTKFVDTLPGLGPTGANSLNNYIPVAVASPWVDPNGVTHNDQDYYEIAIVEYTQQMHSELPKATRLRGYVQIEPPGTATPPANSLHIALTYPNSSPIFATNAAGVGYPVYGYDKPRYLGPTIIATKDRPTRVKYYNLLPKGAAGKLFIPVDTTYMGAGTGPNGTAELYTENRAEIHLHGGLTPWISDGTPHQWITPAGEATSYKKGDTFQNVPDMEVPQGGAATLYYPNQQSARLMFYHDHAYGLTRLNVYVGEAAGYLLTDATEQALMAPGGALAGLSYGTPLIIQDKTFVPRDVGGTNTVTHPPAATGQDTLWDFAKWGQPGDLWFPHVYECNQDPTSADGTNPFGRWDYGPWFWPIFPVLDPVLPHPSGVPEAFMDTPVVNGTAYPSMTVEPKAYRFRVLNACNDRYMNLGLYVADESGTEVKMVPAIPHDATMTPQIDPGATPDPVTGLPAGYWPTTWPGDGRDGGVPDPATAGPKIVQIGTECGFLAAPAEIPSTPIGYEYFRRSVTVLNVSSHGLFMGPAERADIIVDFSAFAGKTLIVYNDAPAPVPAFDARIDYYTGDVDQRANGGADTTVAGKGPNTRTIMQIKVAAALQSAGSAVASVTVGNGGSGYSATPTVTIDAPPAGGVPAVASATVSAGSVRSISFKKPFFDGAAYVSALVTIDPPVSGVQALATASLDSYGGIASITITEPGSGYTTAPGITISDDSTPALTPMVDYVPASVEATLSPAGVITAITVTTPGSGYTTVPSVVITDGTGSAATATATLVGVSIAAFDTTPLATAIPAAFRARNEPPIVPYPGYEAAYPVPAGYGLTWTNHYFHIYDGAANYPTYTFMNTAGTVQTLPIQNKGIQELFDPVYGRMNSTMSVELPFTTALNQTTIPLNYIDPTTETIPAGETQIWKITHNGVDTHAVHFHLVNVQILNRVGWDGTMKPPAENELGWKETVKMHPLEDCIVAARGTAPTLPFGVPNSSRKMDVTSPVGSSLGFTQINPVTGIPEVITNSVADFGWEYVWHCHLLGHEEMDMMRPIKFVVGSTVPDAPIGFANTDSTLGHVMFTWTDPTDASLPATLGEPKNEIGFAIWRASLNPILGGPGAYALIGSVPANTTSYLDPSATADYYYYAVAYNAAGTSAPTAVVTVSVGGRPSAPINLSAVVTGPTQVTLTFTDTANNETGFKVARSVDGGAFVTLAATLPAKAGVGTVTYNDTTTSVGHSYSYRVYAIRVAQLSGFSNVATVSTVLLAPTGLTATIASATSVSLNWTDNASNNLTYLVERSANGGTSWTTLSATVAGTAKTYLNSGAPNAPVAGSTYTYRVTAVSGLSNSPSATVSLIFAAPVTPTGLAIASITRLGATANDSVVVNWSPVVNATTYTINRYTTATATTGGTATTLLTGTTTALTVPRATPGVTRYWFRIQAVNPIGTSAQSAAAGPVTTN